MKTINGKPEYTGAIVSVFILFVNFNNCQLLSLIQDVLTKVIRNEGLFALWKGFTPYYARLGPHTVLTFIFLEQMNKTYKEYVFGDTSSGGGL